MVAIWILVATCLIVATGCIYACRKTLAPVEAKPLHTTTESLHAPAKPKTSVLRTRVAKDIWKSYNSLNGALKGFPELLDTLLVLDERAVLEGRVDSVGVLKHTYDCRYYDRGGRLYGHLYESEAAKPFCHVCEPYEELRTAVNSLIRADRHRRRTIEESKESLTCTELSYKMEQQHGLAERMRVEAGIHNEVTKEIYGR